MEKAPNFMGYDDEEEAKKMEEIMRKCAQQLKRKMAEDAKKIVAATTKGSKRLASRLEGFRH